MENKELLNHQNDCNCFLCSHKPDCSCLKCYKSVKRVHAKYMSDVNEKVGKLAKVMEEKGFILPFERNGQLENELSLTFPMRESSGEAEAAATLG